MTWTSAEIVESYLINSVKVPSLTQYPENSTRCLKSMAVEYQKDGPNADINSSIINAAYNHHIHANSSCFGKIHQNNKTNGKNTNEKWKCKQNHKCRYRMPNKKRCCTTVQDASDSNVWWYRWDGSFEHCKIKEVICKRNALDAFQNTSCAAISESKMSCNSNVAAVMLGPVAQYNFKYNFKDTQKDDTEEYKYVAEACQHTLSSLRHHESDFSESVWHLLVASFVHQKTNIVGSPLASYLTCRDTCFFFSHDTVWCPLHDLKKVLKGG